LPSKTHHIIKQFDSYCKKVVKYHARNYIAEKKKYYDKTTSIHKLPENELAKFAAADEYFKTVANFNVLDYDVEIADEFLAKALQALPANKRDIILLSYFLDMPDREIAERMKLVRRTVTYQKAVALLKLKGFMEGDADEE